MVYGAPKISIGTRSPPKKMYIFVSFYSITMMHHLTLTEEIYFCFWICHETKKKFNLHSTSPRNKLFQGTVLFVHKRFSSAFYCSDKKMFNKNQKIRSKRSLPQQKKRPFSRRMGVVIGGPLSDLISFQATNIWGKLFLSRRLFILDLHTCH